MFEEDFKTTDWAMLARGKTLGKRTALRFRSSLIGPSRLGGFALAQNDILTLQGQDDCAMQLNIALTPPQRLPFGQDAPNLQQLSGTQTNVQVSDPSRTAVSGAWPNMIALLEWGIGGVNCQAEVDFLNGMSVSVSASYVRLRAAFALDNNSGLQNNVDLNGDFEISAFVGPGRTKDSSAQRTVIAAFNLADNTESAPLPIPPFAKRVGLVGIVPNANIGTSFDGRIRFYRDQFNLFANGDEYFAAGDSSPKPIPNGSYFFTVRPEAGFLQNSVLAVFDLSL